MSGAQDVNEVRRYQAPYSGHRPIPTISRYREERAARQEQALKDEDGLDDEYLTDLRQPGSKIAIDDAPETSGVQGGDGQHEDQNDQPMKDTSQVEPLSTDARQRRKEMKDRKRERAEREVTDPVTHLPVMIHDFTDEALEAVNLDEPEDSGLSSKVTGPDAGRKLEKELHDEHHESNNRHASLNDTFPQSEFDLLRQHIKEASSKSAKMTLMCSAIVVPTALVIVRLKGEAASWLLIFVSLACFALLAWGVQDKSSKEINEILQDQVWDEHRRKMKAEAKQSSTESTVWLNSLAGAVWPLINPDLFASLTDTLEDVMQASLPRLVRMVSVDDIGQGSESIRILGIRWLPTGAAAKAVTENGEVVPTQESSNSSGSSTPSAEEESGTKSSNAPQVMDAEEGDFVNMEIAFAYRTQASKRFKKKSKTNDMHLYLAFYLPGNIKMPVWVNLQGIIGTVRMRLQLTPDPPFFALCTVTFLGQPKVNLSCVPLSQRGLNIMDVPLISNFVQSAVDAAVAEYVAPKSLTLNLKDMLAGEDFKKNTVAKGVLMINIKRGYDFRMGDAGIPFFKEGGSDPYVSVGWAKFGKVLWSTRIMKSEMEPCWDETYFMLVTPEEINIEERLRVQLWDSDRFTADDDLGRIEISLKELMSNDDSNGKLAYRTDGFRALKSGDNMPGKLEWSVGYFSKTRILPSQFDQQTHDPEIRSMEQLKAKVDANCERKLREALIKEHKKKRDEDELEQQKVQEFKEEQDAMIISAPPPEGYPSGLFSLQIHNITGLELEYMNKHQKQKDGRISDDEEETGDRLPSSYCTIIVNHRKTFKTRTKPQNGKPFFNAGCERFIRDWRDCEVYVSVRDSRLHEDDPLIGIVHLPLNEIFKERSQAMGTWPLSGGIGFGKIRLSMVWRSLQMQAPPNLLGWQYGTLDIQSEVSSSDIPADLQSAKIKFKSNITTAKMYSSSAGDHATWSSRSGKNLRLATQLRYCSCVSISFRDKKRFLGGDRASAFCVLWLKDIPDEEELDLELPIWKGDMKRAVSNCLEDCGDRVGTLKIKATFWAGMVCLFCCIS